MFCGNQNVIGGDEAPAAMAGLRSAKMCASSSGRGVAEKNDSCQTCGVSLHFNYRNIVVVARLADAASPRRTTPARHAVCHYISVVRLT